MNKTRDCFYSMPFGMSCAHVTGMRRCYSAVFAQKLVKKTADQKNAGFFSETRTFLPTPAANSPANKLNTVRLTRDKPGYQTAGANKRLTSISKRDFNANFGSFTCE